MYQFYVKRAGITALLGLSLGLTACGGGGDNKTETRTIVQTVEAPLPEQVILYIDAQGISESGVNISDGTSERLITTNGVHELFYAPQGGQFNLSVVEQPFDRSCVIENGSGAAVGHDIRSISVTCSDIDSAPQFTGNKDVIEQSYKSTIWVNIPIMDVEGDEVTVDWNLSISPEGFSYLKEPEVLDGKTGTADKILSFEVDMPGEYVFTFTASDGKSESSQNISLNLTDSEPDKVVLFVELNGVINDGPFPHGVLITNGDVERRLWNDHLFQPYVFNEGEEYKIELIEVQYGYACEISGAEGVAHFDSLNLVEISCEDIDAAPQITNSDSDSVEGSYNVPVNYYVSIIDDLYSDDAVLELSVRKDSFPENATFIIEPEVQDRSYYSSGSYRIHFHADTVGEYEFTLIASDGNSESEHSFTVNLINTAPSVSNMRFDRWNHLASDDIEFTGDFYSFDKEGDAVLLTNLQWYINDELMLEGVDELTLAVTEYAYVKDDVIKLVGTFTDGINVVTAEASTTISDSLGVLKLPEFPEVLSEGDEINQSVVWEDLDNESLPDDISMTGPEGATFEDGVITWTAPSTILESQEYSFSFYRGGYSNPLVTRKVTVVKPESNSFVVSGMSIGSRNIGILFSIASKEEDEVQRYYGVNTSGMVYSAKYSDEGFVQEWVYPYKISNASASKILAYDINEDSIPEAIVIAGNTLTIIDGKSKSLLKRATFDSYHVDLLVGDIESDGNLEIVLLTDGNYYSDSRTISILNASDLSVKSTIDANNHAASIQLGNVDSDDALEIIVSNGMIFDGVTLENEWFYTSGFGSNFSVGDLDGDGVSELVLNDQSNLQILDVESKSIVLNENLSTCQTIIADLIDSNEGLELGAYNCNTHPRYFHVYNWDGDALSSLWSEDIGYIGSNRRLHAWNFDGGDEQKVIVGYEGGYGSSSPYLRYVDLGGSENPANVSLGSPYYRNYFMGIEKNSDDLYSYLFLSSMSYSSGAGNLIFTAVNENNEVVIESHTAPVYMYNIDSSALGDVDGDGKTEWLFGTNDRCFAFNQDENDFVWQSADLNRDCRYLATADFNGDGKDEVAYLKGSTLEIFDVENEVIYWTKDNVSSFIVADMDSDSTKEIVLTTGSNIEIYNHSNKTFTLLATKEASVTLYRAHDINNDDIDEVIVSSGNYSDYEVQFYDSSLKILKEVEVSYRPTDVLIWEGEGGNELFAIQGVSGGTTIKSYDLESGKYLWSSNTLAGSINRGDVFIGPSSEDGAQSLVLSTNSAIIVLN